MSDIFIDARISQLYSLYEILNFFVAKTIKLIKVNHGVKRNVNFHFTSVIAKSCNAPLTAKVIMIASQIGSTWLNGFITFRER